MLNQRICRKVFFIGVNGLALLLTGVVSCEAEPNAISKPQSIGPGFNCAKASSVIEKTICNSESLSKLDLDLSNAYKAAKAIKPGVKSEQRKWLKQRNTCKGKRLEACLLKSYQVRIDELMQVKRSGKILPDGWRKFTHSKLIDELNLRNQCIAYEKEKHIRYIDIQKIDTSNELLMLLCDPGAYQDSHMVYLVAHTDSKQSIKPVMLNELKYDDVWKFSPAKKVRGHIQLDKNNNVFTVTRLYNGAATCGYIASYSLKDLLSTKLLNPISAKADNDCFNGVRVDQWPGITLAAH